MRDHLRLTPLQLPAYPAATTHNHTDLTPFFFQGSWRFRCAGTSHIPSACLSQTMHSSSSSSRRCEATHTPPCLHVATLDNAFQVLFLAAPLLALAPAKDSSKAQQATHTHTAAAAVICPCLLVSQPAASVATLLRLLPQLDAHLAACIALPAASHTDQHTQSSAQSRTPELQYYNTSASKQQANPKPCLQHTLRGGLGQLRTSPQHCSRQQHPPASCCRCRCCSC